MLAVSDFARSDSTHVSLGLKKMNVSFGSKVSTSKSKVEGSFIQCTNVQFTKGAPCPP